MDFQQISHDVMRQYLGNFNAGLANGGAVLGTTPVTAGSFNFPITSADKQPTIRLGLPAPITAPVTPQSLNPPPAVSADKQPKFPAIGLADGGSIFDVRQQPTFPALPVSQQPGTTPVTASSTNPVITSADKQPTIPVQRLGLANSGLIPGKVDPTVADDVTINAKRGEYVFSPEVVTALGGPQVLDALAASVKQSIGMPPTVGPKMGGMPDAMGRMDKPGLADGGGVGPAADWYDPTQEKLRGFESEAAKGRDLPRGQGVRVGQGSPVVNTSPAVPVGTPYPPNPSTLPVVRTQPGMPDTTRFERGFSMGQEGATVSPARPAKAPLQIEYGIDGGSRTVPSRGPRPVAPAADVYQDARTMAGTGARPFVNNKALGLITKLANSPVAKGIGMAGAASQLYTGAQKTMQGDYLGGVNDLLAGGGYFAGPVGKAYSAGNAAGTVINSGINALGLGIDPNSGINGDYTPEQQAILDRSAEVKRRMANGTVTPKTAGIPMLPGGLYDTPNNRALMARITAQPDTSDTGLPSRQGPTTTPEQDDASRAAARTASEAGYAKSAAEQDANAERLQQRDKSAAIGLNLKNIQDSIANEARNAAYLATLGPDGTGKDNLAASKIRMDALKEQLGIAIGQYNLDEAAGSKREGLRMGLTEKQIADATARRGQDIVGVGNQAEMGIKKEDLALRREQGIGKQERADNALAVRELANEGVIQKIVADTYAKKLTEYAGLENAEQMALDAAEAAGAIARGDTVIPGVKGQEASSPWFGKNTPAVKARPQKIVPKKTAANPDKLASQYYSPAEIAAYKKSKGLI